MKEIELTQGYKALIDAEDYEKVNQFKWHLNQIGDRFYVKGCVGEWKKKTKVSMHRFIMGLKGGDGKLIDHINHNGLDNRKCNLRICTHNENMKNVVGRKGSSSYKGVFWHKRDKLWYAQIKSDKKTYHLGLFKNEIDAAKAYNEAAKKYHGEFAMLNKI